MDPLILAGRCVVPLILERLPDQAMPKRRYAIGFLGNGRYPEALPALERIVRDSTELCIMRTDALEAIVAIDPATARLLAEAHAKDTDALGVLARDILVGRSRARFVRSWSDAFFGRED